ncbi:MAG: hypothetical protein WC959_04425 [Kiritimatiellales bacterium]
MKMHDLTGFNFTVHADPEVNRIIAGQLRAVAEDLAALLGDRLIAVLAAGGFGRGEGGVVKDEKGIRPVNDYDLYLVVKKVKATQRDYGDRIEAVAQSCAARFGIKQIDMGLVSRWQLLVPRDSITRYEARAGHRIIYGPDHITIRSVRAARLPQREGTQYFFTRGSGLLIARYILENRDQLNNMPWTENVLIELNKAAIALGDAELIRRRRYHWSYAERLRRFEALCDPGCRELLPLYRAAVHQKLNPRFDAAPNAAELELHWEELADRMVERFLAFESNRFRQTFYNLQRYGTFIERAGFNWHGKLYNRLYAVYSGRRGADPDRQRLIAYLLLAGYRDPEYLQRADQMLEIAPDTAGSGSVRWQHSAAAFLKKWHPEGIVGCLLDKQNKNTAKNNG